MDHWLTDNPTPDASMIENSHHNNTREKEKPPDISKSHASNVSRTSRGPHKTHSDTASTVDGIAKQITVRCIDPQGAIS